VYSLVSAPVLGFDLTRLVGGAAVADVLLRALTFTTDDLDPVAALASDDWDRIALWQDVEIAARQRRERAAAATAAGAAGSGESTITTEAADLAGALAVLERTPLGTVDGLLHCVRHDVLDWTWRRHPAGLAQLKSADRTAAVLCDAAVAAYLGDVLPKQSSMRLRAPWTAAAALLPVREPDLGPQAEALTALLERVRTLRRVDIRKLATASSQSRPVLADWSSAVHSAAWSVFVAGRVRAAAAAQLMLVQAVDAAGIPVPDRAGGVWNLLSGAVQALAVRDVLDGPTLYRLLDPVVSALGPIARSESS
jgi:hypothetical protein